MPAALSAVLRRILYEEMQRILIARSQLREIDRLADEHGVQVVVLKGGLAALAVAGWVDLVDVDLLVRSVDVGTLMRGLDALGYGEASLSSVRHLRARVRPGVLQVEVHREVEVQDPTWSAEVWSRVTPVAGMRRLCRLSPKDQLWHLLFHQVIVHPERRGRIRDLVLTGVAVAECSEDDFSEVLYRASAGARGRALLDALAMARELREGRHVPDRFANLAAGLHVLHKTARYVPWSTQPVMGIGGLAVAMLLGCPELRCEVGKIRARTLGRSSLRSLARIEARTPRLGRALRVCLRVIRLPVALLLAAPWAATAAVLTKRVTQRRTR